MSKQLSPHDSSGVGSVIKINGQCLHAFITSVFAWWSWPSEGDYFAWYLLSAISGLVALAGFIGAIKHMLKLYQRDKVLAAFSAQGEGPKTSAVVAEDTLDKAGMH